MADLIRMIIEKTSYEEYLRASQPDFDSRWENVQELVRFFTTTGRSQKLMVDLVQCHGSRRADTTSHG